MGGIIGGVIGGIGSLIGGGDAKQAQQQAAQQAMLGFNYLSQSPAENSYINNGAAANNQIASLLGVGGGGPVAAPQGASSFGQSGQNVLGVLNNPQYANTFDGDPAAAGIQLNANRALLAQAIQSGAPLSQIQQLMSTIAASTTSSGNQPAIRALQSAVGGLQAAPQSAPAGTLGGSVNGPSNNSAFNNYLNSTGYQFQLGQGQQALAGSAAARGLLNSGATAKALAGYGQGLAAQSFNNYLNQLGGLAGAGQTGLGQVGQAGTVGGGNAANFTANAGAVGAASTAGLYGGIGNALGAALQPQYNPVTGASLGSPLGNFFGGI